MLKRWAFPYLLMMLTANRAASDDWAMVHQGYLRTEKYVQFTPTEQVVYATGLVDGMYLAPVFDAPAEGKHLSSLQTCLKEMSNTQVAAIIAKFAKEHPEKWHIGANLVAYQAFREICPVP
jgi:hypothetical protein